MEWEPKRSDSSWYNSTCQHLDDYSEQVCVCEIVLHHVSFGGFFPTWGEEGKETEKMYSLTAVDLVESEDASMC